MKNIQIGSTWVLVGVLAIAAVGCKDTALTPSQTVEHFWTALMTGDMEVARALATEESQTELSADSKLFENNSVSFGKTSIESNSAIVETTISSASKDNAQDETKTTFKTVLDKKEKYWKVNYLSTRKSLEDSRSKKGLSKLVHELDKFGKDVTGKLGEVLKNWEDMGPGIKKDLEDMGNSMQKQLQESIDKHGPEIQNKLEEFSNSLENALKEFENKQPKEKEDKPDAPTQRMI